MSKDALIRRGIRICRGNISELLRNCLDLFCPEIRSFFNGIRTCFHKVTICDNPRSERTATEFASVVFLCSPWRAPCGVPVIRSPTMTCVSMRPSPRLLSLDMLRWHGRSVYVPSPPTRPALSSHSQPAYIPSPPVRRKSAPAALLQMSSGYVPSPPSTSRYTNQSARRPASPPDTPRTSPSPPRAAAPNGVADTSRPSRREYRFMTGDFPYTVSAPDFLSELTVWYNADSFDFTTSLVKAGKPCCAL
jgi:hypothetical protein